jgi:hypothetical protein
LVNLREPAARAARRPERKRISGAFLERAECAIEDLEARAALREVAGI